MVVSLDYQWFNAQRSDQSRNPALRQTVRSPRPRLFALSSNDAEPGALKEWLVPHRTR